MDYRGWAVERVMSRFGSWVLGLGLGLVAAATPLCAFAAAAATTAVPKAVLVTGASTGIGRKITEHLAADGYFVYAGARKDEDLKALNALKNVQGIRLDVTKQSDIDAAVETVKKGGRGLYGLVNNAGIYSGASIPQTSLEEFDLVVAVNISGPWRMTRAFEPLIAASKVRITNIGSISGILADSGESAYDMSKHAIEGFTDSLAYETAPLGIKVSIVEPGSYNSNIIQNAARRAGQTVKPEEGHGGKEPDEVAVAVEQAISEPKPKRRYMVVPERQQADITIETQIQQLVQLNEGQPYTLDRDALVKLLDKALAHSRPKT
jgi:NAD(P)-dependent dehydrogenase (short-subunit alcohol dehydrogenase family)